MLLSMFASRWHTSLTTDGEAATRSSTAEPHATSFKHSCPRLVEVDVGRFNNLNIIRLCLASAVVYSHSFVLMKQFPKEPMQRWFKFYDLGGLAVMCFFFLSGYLIFKSALRSSPKKFVSSRVLRLFPALMIITLMCTLVIGPAATNLPIGDYFADKTTWIYLKTMFLQLGDMKLPGVFAGGTVNQPLWTLSSEWLMYALMLFVCVGITWKERHLTKWDAVAFGSALIFTITLLPGIPWSHAIKWISFAVAGAFAYLVRRWIPLSITLAVLLVVFDIILLLSFKTLGKILFVPSVAYFLLVAGFHPRLHFKLQHRFGDYSYGIYIIGWPCQQIVKPFVSTPDMMFVFAFPMALVCAVLSWHFVEAPSLRSKHSKRRPLEPLLPISHA